MPRRLEGKVAIITGAGSGYGRGIAKKFLDEGARVIIAELSKDRGEAAAAELNTKFVLTDVTKRESWQDLLRAVKELYGGLDIVVNNAGAIYVPKATATVSDAEFDMCIDVNVRSVFLSASVLIPYFEEAGKPGCFIQVASASALRPRPDTAWYAASKAAVTAATKAMAVEYAPKKIRFNSVCPSLGRTLMTQLFMEKHITDFEATLPLGRCCVPECGQRLQFSGKRRVELYHGY